MKLKKYLALLCALAMLLMLVSCGGQGAQTVILNADDPQIEDSGATDPAVTGEDGETDPAPAAPKTVDVTGDPSDGNTPGNSPTESANSEGAGEPAEGGASGDETPPQPVQPTEPTQPVAPTEPTEPVTPEPPQPAPDPTPEPAPAPAPEPAPEPTPEPEPEPTPGPTPHTHSYTDTRTEPTCTQDGKIVSKCSCGDTKTTTIPKLGHDYKETSRTAATCTADGNIVYTCSRCGDTKTETVPALGHDYSVPVYDEHEVEQVEMQCHTFCGACGVDFSELGYSQSQLDEHMEAHMLKGESSRTYQEWIEVVIGTTTERTLVGYKCSRCGAVK